MFILLPALLLLITAAALTVLQVFQPAFRYAWLIASAGALLAWLSVWLWLPVMPSAFSADVYLGGTRFLADSISWPYALSLTTLALAVIITSVVRPNFPNLFSWAGTCALSGLGLLAVLANGPITLSFVWVALDLSELAAHLRPAGALRSTDRTVVGFGVRLVGTLLLLWAAIYGKTFSFETSTAQGGLLFIIAAAMRLGALPAQISNAPESSMHRGFGTSLQLVSAAASLILLARVPVASADLPLAPFLLLFTAATGLYAAFLWMRAPDELSGRPFWIIALASLAVAASLRGNPSGSLAWGCALLLAGGALFLASVHNNILARGLAFAGAWGLSALPFSVSAIGWQSGTPAHILTWVSLPTLILAQALLTLGFIRHALRPANPSALEAQPIWARNLYPIGIGFLLTTLILLGLLGWDGARALGSLPTALTAGATTAALYWLTPRLRWLNPASTRSIATPVINVRFDTLQQFFGGIYRGTGRFIDSLSAALEGEGGILWTLLFLVLFLSLLAPRTP